MITVIIPVYNAVAFVEEAVQSALIQPEVSEIIIIEDGSADGSLQICERLASTHQIITLLRHPEGINKGAGSSRNLGIQHASNEWIAFLDADDYYLEGRFKTQLEIISTNENVALVCSGAILLMLNGECSIQYPTKNIEFGLLFGGKSLGSTSCNLWSKKHLLAVNGFDYLLSSSQEYDLMFRLYKQGNTFKIDVSTPKTVVREHDGNRISNLPSQILGKNWINLRQEMISFFNPHEINLSSAEARKLLSTLIGILRKMSPAKSNQRLYFEFYEKIFSNNVNNLGLSLSIRHLIYKSLGFNTSESIIDAIRWIIRK